MGIEKEELQSLIESKKKELVGINTQLAQIDANRNTMLTEGVHIQGEIRMLTQLIEKMQG